ncbi:unknown [Akkermansia muciniphila CAG:154]|nr:unknown [Akkermansia muciniphila CAG:154]
MGKLRQHAGSTGYIANGDQVIGRQGRGHDELRRSHMDPGAGMDGRQLRHRRQAGPIRKGKLFLCNNCLIRCHNQ